MELNRVAGGGVIVADEGDPLATIAANVVQNVTSALLLDVQTEPLTGPQQLAFTIAIAMLTLVTSAVLIYCMCRMRN